jgi:hypothetical protein
MFNIVNFMTRENTYATPPGDHPKGKDIDHSYSSTASPYSNPL